MAHPTKGKTKVVLCSRCSAPRTVGWSFAPSLHDTRCDACAQKDAEVEKVAEEAKWASLIESLDYVKCLGCTYKAKNLTSHVQSAHPEWVGCYPGQMVAERSPIRDKTALKGRKHTPETIALMKASAGWNRGLTKETDERVANAAKAMKGRVSWSKGLTKKDHPGLQSTSEKLSAIKTGIPNDAARLDLSLVDFTPYLDETGAVDRKSMAEELDLSEPTITKYMEHVGLRLSTKYVDARAERTTIRIEKQDLERFAMENGKIVIAQAMLGLGRDYKVIRRECDRHGLETFNHAIRQTLCLDAVSKALGDVFYAQEWKSMKFVNPNTGHRFRFDGFFSSHNLVVEFHGYQHWTFPSVYIKKDEVYFALQERDRIKENLIQGDPTLRYFLVREDEPYTNVAYLRGRLIDEGILDPGK